MKRIEISANVLQFRHPLTGAIVRRSFAKLNGTEQGRIEDDVNWLREHKPSKRDDLPNGRDFHGDALEAWFRPVELALKGVADAREQERHKIRMSYQRQRLLDMIANAEMFTAEWFSELKLSKFEVRLIDQIQQLKADLATAQRERDEARAQVVGVIKATGHKTEAEKKITMAEASGHWKKVASFKSQAARAKCLFQVDKFIDAIGPATRHSTVTRADIIDAMKRAGKTEAGFNTLYTHVARLFRELAHPTEADGLALANPFCKISTIQRDDEAGIQTADPAALLALPLAPEWRALVALCGYAGLRLAEAGAMKWENIDFAARLIHVRPTDVYPKLKSVLSKRDVKPFGNAWKILEAYRKHTGGKGALFTKPNGESWFRTVEDKPSAGQLSAEFILAIKEHSAELAPEPARRLRRYWETTMRAQGLGSMIEAMGGHTDKVGKKHYTDWAKVVAAANIPELSA